MTVDESIDLAWSIRDPNLIPPWQTPRPSRYEALLIVQEALRTCGFNWLTGQAAVAALARADLPTIDLRGNVRVLAKPYRDGLSPVTYANKTQAERKRTELVAQGINASFYQPGRPIYIRID